MMPMRYEQDRDELGERVMVYLAERTGGIAYRLARLEDHRAVTAWSTTYEQWADRVKVRKGNR